MGTVISATRYHDFSAGHRVVGHESKCRHLHGHNYRVHFTIESLTGLDELGRVLDFSVIKNLLCEWLEENWDHKFLAWEDDVVMSAMVNESAMTLDDVDVDTVVDSMVWLPFNPTAENMAEYLLNHIGPHLLHSHGCKLTNVVIEETRKCSVEARAE